MLGFGEHCPVHGPGAKTGRGRSTQMGGPPVAELCGLRLGRKLGAGGFASIWQLGDDRVAKIAHVSHQLARARMAREAEALAAVGEPAVPAFFGSGVLDDGRAWLIMARVEGTTLAQITAAGPQDIRSAVAIAVGILESVARIHAAGFVHRDLKPENLIRRPDGTVVALDLGLARKMPHDPDDPTRENVQVGSLEYMPPEQIADSSSVDERSDLYAFGCVLYELIAGRPPFAGDAAALERAHVALRPERLGRLVANVPVAIEALCNDCLAKERARRPESAVATAARLQNAVAATDERRSSPAISTIRESAQPVVLLWVELPRIDRALLSIFAARRLIIASQRGRRIIAGAVGGEQGDPATIAIVAARELAAVGARVALHLESLHVGMTDTGQTLAGEAISHPTWVPATAWSGVVMSRALAAATQVATQPSELGPDYLALGDDQRHSLLFGRDALLADLQSQVTAVLGDATRAPLGPGFCLLIGDSGVGKTAVANELGRRLIKAGASVHLVTISTPGTGKPASGPLAESLGISSAPRGQIVRIVGDALRAAARVRPTVVILDDLHLGDHELYDALEYATLGGEPLPLWVLGVAARRIDAKRPQLGARAERRCRQELAPLDEAAAVELAAALLQPAEYPPLHALRNLVSIAQGNPLHLCMLAREIHERGAIRSRPGGADFLDTTALDDLSPAALAPWLAARELASLAPELAAFARVCAVLAGEESPVGKDELSAILEAVEQAGGATTTVDVAVGLAELEATGIVMMSPQGFQFRQSLVKDGIYATTDEHQRLAIHNAALTYWIAASGTIAAEHVARHADIVGNAPVAARAFAVLGERALAEYHEFDADVAWSGALRHLTEPTVERARALLGRGKARYRMQRIREAVSDLEQAVALSAALGAIRVEVEALLVQALALDFLEGMSDDLDYMHGLVIRARDRYREAKARWPDIELDLQVAEVRKMFRQQQYESVIPLLRRLKRRAQAQGYHDTATAAALMLGAALADGNHIAESSQVFADLLADCDARDDRFSLTVSYVNRTWLWTAVGAVEQLESDLEHVIQLAREHGLAFLERAASHNLAEHKLWLQQYDEAILLARRGLLLQSTVAEGPIKLDQLLLARAHAATGNMAELNAVLAAMTSSEGLTPHALIALAIVRAIAAQNHNALVAAAASLPEVSFVQLRLELGALAAARNALDDLLRRRLFEDAQADRIWKRRSSEFAGR